MSDRLDRILARLDRICARLDRIERQVRGLVSVQELAAWADVCEQTIRNRRRKADIKWCNVHGQRWREGDGPKRILMSEWTSVTETDPQIQRA